MPTTIRPFKADDSPALWAVYCSAVHETASADYTPRQLAAWAPPDLDPENWHRRVAALSPFVAERDGVVVGYADLQPNGYIDHFFVSATAGRKGVGARLMQAILQSAADSGLRRLFADVSVTARPFFEQWGFTVEETKSHDVRGETLRNFLMSRTLA